MDSILEVKQALSARSETTSVDELKNQGKSRIRVIKAAQIAQLIEEAVARAVEKSGYLPPDEVDRLVAESKQEFSALHKERQQEQSELVQLREELEAAQARVAELEAGAGAAAPAAAGLDSDMVMKLMTEVAQLKAGAQSQPAAEGGGGEAANALFAAIDKMGAAMNERLEQFGRKMGVSSAVEADSVSLEGLFNKMDDVEMESNIENLEVKSKTGSGIAGNLERLKKLKGG